MPASSLRLRIRPALPRRVSVGACSLVAVFLAAAAAARAPGHKPSESQWREPTNCVWNGVFVRCESDWVARPPASGMLCPKEHWYVQPGSGRSQEDCEQLALGGAPLHVR